jgi:cytochrome c-type biogenesis protein CcmH
MANYFWFIAGILAGVCAAFVMLPLMRGARESMKSQKVRVALIAGGVLVFAAAAFFMYRALGTPEAIVTSPVAAAASPHPGVGDGKPGNAQSMESVVASLEARLSREGGKREDWLLLAQSYDYLGRTADAQRARQQAESIEGPAGSNTLAQVAAAMARTEGSAPQSATAEAAPPAAEEAATFEKRVKAKPSDADSWKILSAIYRRQHDYEKARNAFGHLIELKAMNADEWADYADVLASLNSGSLRGKPSQAIDSALRLQPKHPKGLWLKASLAYEEHRYGDALAVWRQLRAVLPPDSSDVRIVDANIAEALQLSGQPVATATANSPLQIAAATSGAGTEVTGTVAIDSKLASRVPAGATLFIYAKDADSAGPPLAVLRQVAGSWPVAFRLDDSLAMMPARKLSQFDRIVVEARISKSGQATPASGDLFVTSAVLTRAQRQKVALVINHEIG